jgi:hypothetical protein
VRDVLKSRPVSGLFPRNDADGAVGFQDRCRDLGDVTDSGGPGGLPDLGPRDPLLAEGCFQDLAVPDDEGGAAVTAARPPNLVVTAATGCWRAASAARISRGGGRPSAAPTTTGSKPVRGAVNKTRGGSDAVVEELVGGAAGGDR